MPTSFKKKEIGKYDANGELVKTYLTKEDIVKSENISPHAIGRSLRGEKKNSIKGFFYRYTGNVIDLTPDRGSNPRNVRLDIENCTNLNISVWKLRVCPICGKEFYARKKYEKITCSEECYNKYVELHKDEISQKKRIASYNAFHSKTKDEIAAEHEKARQTCLKRYGVPSAQQTEKYREKMREIQLSKDWSERSKKLNESLIPKYRAICEADNLELVKFRNRFDCDVKCKKCGFEFSVHILGYLTPQTTTHLCRHCYPNANSTSRTEPVLFVEKILKDNNIDFIRNDRFIINPQELDIVIPSKNIAVEIDGVYWHSEIEGHKDKTYHIDKTKKGFSQGYKVIHIFDDEITHKPQIVASRILNLIGKTPNKIYARKCEIKEIDSKTKKAFFEKNHIDGDSISKWNIGLFYDGELVSAATFGHRKISGSNELELIRFASLINYNVVGGFSRLFKYFIKTYNPKKIITYADVRWSGIDTENNVYTKNGFSYVETTHPNYFYTGNPNYSIRLNRLNFTKQRLVEQGYNKNLTERQIMIENGYDRIWDCGSLKFEYTKK
jgi:very-short-patch-repair endonuclease